MFADGAAADVAAPRAPGAVVAPPGAAVALADPRVASPFAAAAPVGWLPPARCAPTAGPGRPAAVLGALRTLSPPPPPPPGPPAFVGPAALRAAAASAAPRPTVTPARNPSATSTNPTNTFVTTPRPPGFEPLIVQEVAVGIGGLVEFVRCGDRFRRRLVVWRGHACGPPCVDRFTVARSTSSVPAEHPGGPPVEAERHRGRAQHGQCRDRPDRGQTETRAEHRSAEARAECARDPRY